MEINTLEDCCTILEVAPGCSDEQIKRAYHRLILLYHPDKNVTDTSSVEEKRANTEKFDMVTKAYKILTKKESLYEDNSPSVSVGDVRGTSNGSQHNLDPKRMSNLFKNFNI